MQQGLRYVAYHHLLERGNLVSKNFQRKVRAGLPRSGTLRIYALQPRERIDRFAHADVQVVGVGDLVSGGARSTSVHSPSAEAVR